MERLDAPNIFQHRARGKRRKCDDLRDGFPAIFIAHIFDHFLALVIGEIDIDIGHRHALRIQEALEEEIIFYGIDIRNSQRIRHKRSRRRAAPRPHANAARRVPLQ